MRTRAALVTTAFVATTLSMQAVAENLVAAADTAAPTIFGQAEDRLESQSEISAYGFPGVWIFGENPLGDTVQQVIDGPGISDLGDRCDDPCNDTCAGQFEIDIPSIPVDLPREGYVVEVPVDPQTALDPEHPEEQQTVTGQTPVSPQQPQKPEPQTPTVPTVPEVNFPDPTPSSAPDLPSEPALPSVPDKPKGSDVPQTPENPAPIVPVVPNQPAQPETPATPESPVAENKPTIRTVGQVEELAQTGSSSAVLVTALLLVIAGIAATLAARRTANS